MQKKRKLKNGVTVYELDEAVELIVKTKDVGRVSKFSGYYLTN